MIGNSAYGNAFLFTGRVFLTWDTYEYRARLYNAYLGRFMSEDPTLYDGGDYNLFRYCNNDPVGLTDPMGTQVGSGAEQMYTSRSEDRLWDLQKHFDSSNNSPAYFAGFGGTQGLTMAPIGVSGRSSASVEFLGSMTERRSPQEIANSKDPGAGPSVKSYTLEIVGKTRVDQDTVTGSVNVAIPVGAKKVLPNNTTKYDQAEKKQVVSIFEAVIKADSAVRQVASRQFPDAKSFQRAVETEAHKVLLRENRQRILFTDMTPW